MAQLKRAEFPGVQGVRTRHPHLLTEPLHLHEPRVDVVPQNSCLAHHLLKPPSSDWRGLSDSGYASSAKMGPMKETSDVPEAVQIAQRVYRKYMMAIVGFSVGGWIPVLLLDKLGIVGAGTTIVAWLGIGAVASLLMDWSKMGRAQTVIQAYAQQNAEAVLTDDTPVLDDDDPLHAIAKRLRELAQGDEAVSALVADLHLQMDKAERDLESLTAAVNAEVELGSSENESRLQRLKAVASEKQGVLDQLASAMRDLHVELTIRQDDDHGALIAQVRDALDRIAAETEVVQVLSPPSLPESPVGQADTNQKRAAQRRESEKERH